MLDMTGRKMTEDDIVVACAVVVDNGSSSQSSKYRTYLMECQISLLSEDSCTLLVINVPEGAPAELQPGAMNSFGRPMDFVVKDSGSVRIVRDYVDFDKQHSVERLKNVLA